MVVTAAANLVVAFAFTAYWPLFMAVFPMASKIALFAIQYTTVRHFAMREVRAERAALAAQAAAAEVRSLALNVAVQNVGAALGIESHSSLAATSVRLGCLGTNGLPPLNWPPLRLFR